MSVLHEAYFYRTMAEFVAAALPFVEEGLVAGESRPGRGQRTPAVAAGASANRSGPAARPPNSSSASAMRCCRTWRSRTARTGARRGRGLWLANEMCDLVQIRSSAHGTVIRVHMMEQPS